jgi:HSP20 family molecular chaperone IbpA
VRNIIKNKLLKTIIKNMFWKKSCRFCGYKLNSDWDFCPKCGRPVREENIEGIFSSMFDDIEKEFERIDKMFRMSDFDVKPQVRGGSIHITVQSGTGMKPRVKIKTTGDYKALEPEIRKKLGMEEGVKEVKEKSRKVKITEEPETKKIVKGGKTIIKLELPGVKSEEDIEVKRLEQSIEVKAFAGDKAYFKLIPIPESATINKTFKDGVLEIEIER